MRAQSVSVCIPPLEWAVSLASSSALHPLENLRLFVSLLLDLIGAATEQFVVCLFFLRYPVPRLDIQFVIQTRTLITVKPGVPFILSWENRC